MLLRPICYAFYDLWLSRESWLEASSEEAAKLTRQRERLYGLDNAKFTQNV